MRTTYLFFEEFNNAVGYANLLVETLRVVFFVRLRVREVQIVRWCSYNAPQPSQIFAHDSTTHPTFSQASKSATPCSVRVKHMFSTLIGTDLLHEKTVYNRH